MKFFLIGLLLLSQTVQATTCSPRNLITEENSPFQKIPVYDQDGIGICFAYASAQLVDYNLIKRGATSRAAHPFWLALTNAWQVSKEENSERVEISLGNVRRTVTSLENYQNCPYDVVTASLATWARKANTTDAEVLNFIETYTKKFRPLYDARRAEALLNNTNVLIDDIDILTLIRETKSDESMKFCSATATWDKLLPELKALSSMTTPAMLTKLLMPACEAAKYRLDIPKAKIRVFESTDGIITGEISAKLDQLNAPVSLSYCSKALTEPMQGILTRLPLAYAKECEQHESLIVGKRQSGNSCQLLLRNTWGPNFGDWTKGKKCLCKHRQTGTFLEDCTRDAHNNGQYTVEACWIDEDLINKNAYQMTVLEN